ncbi:hypothetical protein YC2023_039029 [Brassica napus]
MDENSNDFSEAVDKCFNMYNPRLKIDKLLFLADRGVNRTESLSVACRLTKLGDSTNLLRRVRSKYNMESDADDSLWLMNVFRRADERFSRAKSTYESSCFSQETINLEGKRKLYSKLGQLHYYSGDLGKAFENHLQELAHCTMVNQRIDSNMKLILVSLKRGKLDDVPKWVNENRTQYGPLESIVAAKVACAHALSHMGLGEYKTAALEFLDVDCVALGDTFDQVILPHDVATYGGLCALATYDRSEIQQRVFENDHAWLGLAPEVRKIIKEAAMLCVEYLQTIKKTLLLDMYVYQHVEWLLCQIREKALLEYAQPFASLRMCTMASQFRSSVPDLEEELMALIKKNKLEFAKVVSIDPHNARWYYKSFRKMVKIYCGLGEYEKMMDATRKMLKYIKGSYQGDSVYRFLQSLCTYSSLDLNMLQELCKITMEALEENKKQYLTVWFRTSLELRNILFDNRQYTPIKLHKYYQNVDETNDVAKTRDLRKVYVIEFQLYTETDDKRNKKVRKRKKNLLTIFFY